MNSYPMKHPVTHEDFLLWLKGKDDDFREWFYSKDERFQRLYEREVRKDGFWFRAGRILPLIALVVSVIVLLLRVLLMIL